MAHRRQMPRLLALAAAALLLAPLAFTTRLNIWLQSLASPPLTLAMNLVSLLGYTASYIVFAAILGIFWKRRAAIALIALLALNAIVIDAAKALVDHPRPDAVDRRVHNLGFFSPSNLHAMRQSRSQSLIHHSFVVILDTLAPPATTSGVEDDYGFPSGHVSAATVFCLGLPWFFGLRRRWIGLLVWVPAMAISRMYLGRHFAGDVLGGFAIGIVIAIIGAELLGLVLVPRERPQSA